jgi:hypothetical protein
VAVRLHIGLLHGPYRQRLWFSVLPAGLSGPVIKIVTCGGIKACIEDSMGTLAGTEISEPSCGIKSVKGIQNGHISGREIIVMAWLQSDKL